MAETWSRWLLWIFQGEDHLRSSVLGRIRGTSPLLPFSWIGGEALR